VLNKVVVVVAIVSNFETNVPAMESDLIYILSKLILTFSLSIIVAASSSGWSTYCTERSCDQIKQLSKNEVQK